MIYTDGIHLISDKSLDELHAFAQFYRLKRHRFQGGKRRHPHYDLPKRGSAIDMTMLFHRAKVVSTRELVKISLSAEWRK